MQWDDLGYLISKNKYNENSLVAEFFTKEHGKCSGIIFGATSKKIKNYLEIGNKLNINYNYKEDGRIGYFKVEILKVNSPFYFDNKKKLLCINSAMNLIKILTVDLQENVKIFNIIDKFFDDISTKSWKEKYIFWELKLLELLGFKLDLKKISTLDIDKNEYFIKKNNLKKIVPKFLIDSDNFDIDNNNILNAFSLIGDFLEKNILKPNNINYPHSRLDFVNSFKL
jgi:DNA repair protein RecO (recombination protein O)